MINSPKKLRTQIYGTWAAALCLFFLLLLPTTQAQAYSGYVGESISLNAPSVPGTIGGASWTSDIGAVTVSGNHYGATAYINYYFTGTARVTLKYTYFNGSKTVYSSTQYAYYDITCKASTTTLNKRSVTMKPGQEVTLTYTNSSGYDAPSVVWNTSDYKIATIDGYKSVTGEKTVTVYAEDIGECTITCNANTGPTNPTCTIIVKGDPPTAVALPSTASTKVGESVTLTPTLTPSDAYAKFTWTSSNEAVATVSSSGKVTGKNVGTTTITVTTDNGLSAKSTITVGKASVTITADTESGVYTAGKKVTLKANRSDADIYYTLDGRTPTTSSTRYTAPITLSKSVMLKAIATGGNYETSDVLTREYTITSLTVKSYWSDIEEQNPYFIPTVTFSKTVNAHTNIEGITLSMGKTTIDGQALVQDGILFFVPDNTLSPGSYTLSIPENAVIDGVGDPNLATTLNLQIGKGIEPMAQQAAAGYSHSLAVKTDGSLWVWGSGLYGKLGTGNTSSISWPKKIMDDVAQVAAYTHSLFVKTDGSLWACGYNKYGQLGDGTTTDIKTPVKVKDGVRRVACGNYHTLIIKTDGSLWVCGFNEYGQLGDNTTTDRHNPVKIMDGVAQVAGGGYHTLIVKTDGSLWTCGLNNYGQLGDGTTTNRLMPVKIMDNVVQVAAGWRHSLAIKSDGSLWTWGLNGAGELGDGTKIDRYTPVKVMDDVAQASAQWYYSIAVKTDGTLWAWGRNYHGQFGDGTYTDRTSPKIIMDNVVQASAGNGHTLVIKKDGSLWACGDNDAGELGDGTTKDKSKFICVWDVSSFSKITGASLAKTSIQIAQGKQYLLLPVVTPTDGCIQNIAFESSDPSVATVSPRGIVKGVKNGTATITMTVDGKYTVTCTIKVGQGGATQLQLTASPSGGEVTEGTKVYLSTTNATGADIYYTLNGSTPSRNSTKYTSAGITISSDCTLKAIAYKDGYADSDVLTISYVVKQSSTEDSYYYVGQLNGWDITDRSYPFMKSDDGTTWSLTMNATMSDEFLIVPGTTTDWDGIAYGAENSSLSSGNVVRNEGHNNFRVPYWPGMDMFKIDLNISKMSYSMARHRSTTTTTCAGVQAGTVGKSYRVAGIVGNITNTTYGNWYLSDATGEIYIYGTRDRDGYTGKNNSIDVWNIETGDSVIVVGEKNVYNGIVELVDVGVEKVTKKNPFIIENGIMQVTPQDSLQLAVAYAPSNTTIKLSAGNYYINYPTLDYYGGLSIQKDLTIEGEGMGVTTIHGRFDMQNGAGLTLKNLTLDGENTNQTQPIIYRDDVAYSDLVILDCEIKSYQKGFLYVNVASEINNITINNCLIHDIEGLQDFFDCRQGYYANFVLMNSTIYNCCTNGRDFFRLDDSSSSFVNPRSPQITVKQCTFYQVGNSGDTRLFYVRFEGNKISFTDNVIALFSGSRGFANVSKTDPTPTLSNNFYYKTENLCSLSSNGDESIKWFDASGTILNPNDQLFQDVENHNYRVLSQAVIKSKAGDPRWLKDALSTIVITASSAGYATFYSSKSAYTLPSGLSAQVVTGASGGKLTYRTIADGSVSGVVPKGTAVMLVSNTKQGGTFTLTPSESTTTYSGTNLLHGSDEATTSTGDGYHYKLSYGPTGTQWNDVFGWYWGAQNGAPFQIEGHKAWLVVPSSNGTRAAGFSIEGDVLGIESVEDPAVASDLYYDLQGRRVSQPAQKGFYIKNGKKVVLK